MPLPIFPWSQKASPNGLQQIITDAHGKSVAYVHMASGTSQRETADFILRAVAKLAEQENLSKERKG